MQFLGQLPLVWDGHFPPDAGLIATGLLASALVATGVFRCFLLLARKETEKLCITSLLLAFLALLCSTASQTAWLLLKDQQSLGLSVRLALLVPVLPLIAFSLALAISGLLVFRTKRERFSQGKTSAVWALGLNVPLLGVVVSAALTGFQSNPRQTASEPTQPLPSTPLQVESRAKPESTVRIFEPLNFRFEMPGSPWVSVNPKRVNPSACLILQKPRDPCLFMIVAEKAGIDFPMNTQRLVELSKSNFAGTTEHAAFEDVGEKEQNGIRYTVFRANGRRAGVQHYYTYWIATHNGWLYQLISGSTRSQILADSTAEGMNQRFRLVDANAKCYSARAITEPVYLPELGLTAHLERDGWSRWDWKRQYPSGDFGAALGNGSTLALISFDLRGFDPRPDDLTAACVRVLWNNFYSGQVNSTAPFERSGLKGIEVHLEHTFEERKFQDVLWVYRHLNRAYCILTWTDAGAPDQLDRVTRVIDLLEHGSTRVAEANEKLSDPQRKVRSQLFNELGVRCHSENKSEDALNYFKTACLLYPDDPVVANNLANTLETDQKFQEAAEFLESIGGRFTGDARLQLNAREARDWQLAGDQDKALLRYQEVFNAGLNHEDYLMEYVQLLRKQRSAQDALSAIEAYEKQHPSDGVLRAKAGFLADLDRKTECVALLEKRLKAEPFPPGLAYDLAAYSLQLDGKEKRCLELCDLMESKGGRSWEVSWLRGNAYMKMERYFDAKRAFEAALGANKENPLLVKQSLAFASAALGEGDNSMVKEEIPPVAIPASLLKLWDSYDITLKDSHGFKVLSNVTSIHFKKGEPEVSTRRQVVKITARNGLEYYKTLRFPFNPVYERLYLNRLIVRNSAGKVAGEGDVSDYYVMDESAGEMATGEKILYAPVPGLEVGATLEFIATKKRMAPAEECHFERYPFFSMGPSRFTALVVTGDSKEVGFEAPPAVTVRDGENYRAWTLKKPPIAWPEDLQPQFEKFLPYVYLGSKSSNWSKAGEDYLETLATLLNEKSPLVDEAARKVTQGMTSPDDKIRALTRYVQTQLSYQAMEFGKRGRIPRQASRCLRNRYGDCKEHALLLRQLLRAVDIPSYLTLVDIHSPVIESLPSLDQFNHMIVYIPRPGSAQGAPGSFVDCTDDYLAFGSLPPDGLAGQKTLILEPGKVRLAGIPPYPAESSKLNSERRIVLTNNENLSVRELLTASGYHASWLRSYFASRDSASKESRVQEMLKYDGLRLKSLELSDLDKPELPFRIQMEFELTENCKRNPDGALDILLPGVWERHFLDPAFRQERKTPFEWSRPLRVLSTVELENSTGVDWSALNLGNLAKSGKDDFHAWSFSRKNHSGGVTLRLDLERRSFSCPPERYPEYLKSAELSLQLWHDQLSLGPVRGLFGSWPRLDIGRARPRPISVLPTPSEPR